MKPKKQKARAWYQEYSIPQSSLIPRGSEEFREELEEFFKKCKALAKKHG